LDFSSFLNEENLPSFEKSINSPPTQARLKKILEGKSFEDKKGFIHSSAEKVLIKQQSFQFKSLTLEKGKYSIPDRYSNLFAEGSKSLGKNSKQEAQKVHRSLNFTSDAHTRSKRIILFSFIKI
jgi:hypothetical protein